MGERWKTVFTGPMAEATVVRSMLEARGIPVYIPGESIRPMAPLGDLGVGLTLDPEVQVPESAAEAARACIEAGEEGTPIRPDEQELPADFFAPDESFDLKRFKRARTLSRCIIWGALFPLGAPFALWNLGPYLKEVESLGCKPPHHRITIVAACFAPLNLLPIVFSILKVAGQG
jgi:hypothetical protein